jgi:hypothetical protein
MIDGHSPGYDSDNVVSLGSLAVFGALIALIIETTSSNEYHRNPLL